MTAPAFAFTPSMPNEKVLQRLGFLLDQFRQQNPGVSHVFAVSGDGIPLTTSRGADPKVRDQLCASISGLTGMACGIARLLQAADPQDIVVNYGTGWLVVQRPSARLCLAVLVSEEADMAAVHHQLLRLGEAAGQLLEPAARPPA